MKKMPGFIILIIAILIGLTSCQSTKILKAVKINFTPGISKVGNESYKDAGVMPYFSVGTEVDLLSPDFQNSVINDLSTIDEDERSSGFSLSPGINFSKQGGKYKEDGGLEGKIATSYLNASLYCRYLSAGGFYLEAGLQPGILLSSRDKYLDVDDDYSHNTNKFHLGLPLGFGYRFRNGFGIGARAIPGLTSIHPTDDDEDEPNKNFVAGINLSYKFSSKKK